MDEAFGSASPFALGVEEELFLVDPGSGELRWNAEEVIGALDEDGGRWIGHEAYACQVESRTPPSRSAGEAVRHLAEQRRRVLDTGATLMASGLHPTVGFGEVRLVESERYKTLDDEVRGLVRRSPEAALHVHVGTPDSGTAVRVHDGLRSWLPLLTAISASSPFWLGHDSGLAAARMAFVAAYPGRGVPEALGSYDRYLEKVEELTSLGGPDDYTMLWWALRIHPKHGTVEVREMDAQSRLEDAAAMAGLVRGLAAAAAHGEPGEPESREAIEWSMFRAMRDGPDGEILHEGTVRPVAEVARHAAEVADRHLAELGDEPVAAGVERLMADGGARRQRRAHESGGMREVIRTLCEETGRSAGPGRG